MCRRFALRVAQKRGQEPNPAPATVEVSGSFAIGHKQNRLYSIPHLAVLVVSGIACLSESQFTAAPKDTLNLHLLTSAGVGHVFEVKHVLE